MLPGFRFLFTAIVLSMSVLVFGLGAAALLRAAHEEFASNPSWHAPPETMFAQQADTTRPVLAMLHFDPPAADKAPDNVPAVTAPPPAAMAPTPPATAGSTTPEPAAIASAPAERNQIAALQPADSPPPATATPEMPVAKQPPPVEAAPAQDETSAPQAAVPAAADETRIAATEQVPAPASEAAPAAQAAMPAEAAPAPPAAPEPAAAPSLTDASPLSTKIATLGGPPVLIKPAAKAADAKAADAKADKSAIKKRDQAKRAHRRRRIASVAAETQPVDPFAAPAAVLSPRRKPR